MSGVIDSLERAQLRNVPDFHAGDRVKVHFQVVEGTRRRTQVFEGIVIKRQGSGARETFTVRKQSFGVGVERTFPVHSPKIERIEVASRGDVRRAKLYYLRGRVGRRARVRERQFTGPAAARRARSSRRQDAARGAGRGARGGSSTSEARAAAEQGTPPAEGEGDAAAAQAGGEGQIEETVASAEDPAAEAARARRGRAAADDAAASESSRLLRSGDGS